MGHNEDESPEIQLTTGTYSYCNNEVQAVVGMWLNMGMIRIG